MKSKGFKASLPKGAREKILEIYGASVESSHGLQGGCIADVVCLSLSSGERLVVKRPQGSMAGDILLVEARMLRYLKEHTMLPVPDVIYSGTDSLVLSWLDNEGALTQSAQRHAAELLADLHSQVCPYYGFWEETVLGAKQQPNPQESLWIPFFRDHRLLYMAHQCLDHKALPTSVMRKIERLALRLDDYLEEPPHPSLIHGDMWGGNVLASKGRISGFIDPAIYFAHAEIELAYSTLFGTFGDSFFRRYHEIRPISPGFFDVRRDIYNLWHLLSHVYTFGGSYLRQVISIVDRLV